MTSRLWLLAVAALCAALPGTSRAETDGPTPGTFTAPIAVYREQVRPPLDNLPVPPGFTRDQIVHGDRVFHGEAANGQCSVCHGIDAKGTTNGNDLTTGRYIWGDGSVASLRTIVMHNMAVVPGMDGDLRPADVDAVAAYVWALGRPNR